jgi:hypothetical protein
MHDHDTLRQQSLPLFEQAAQGKVCRGCDTWKPQEAYYKAPAGARSSDGYRARCKECWAGQNARYRAQNGEVRLVSRLLYARSRLLYVR